MSLIIGIGHGQYTDPFSTSTNSEPNDDVSEVEDCLLRLQVDKFPSAKLDTIRTWVDEILVVENDEVVHHFTWEDGLGEPLPEAEEEDPDIHATPSDFIDFSSEEDESDSDEV